MTPCPIGDQTPNTRNQSAQRTPGIDGATLVKAIKTCFNRGKPGHMALQCPDRHQPSTPTQGMTAPPNRNGNSTLTQAKQNYAQGRVNQVTMEEAHNAPTMVTGTLFVNSILS
jgi:hypothetical protein